MFEYRFWLGAGKNKVLRVVGYILRKMYNVEENRAA